MKKFYSIKLRQFKENIPPALAETMLLDESKLVKYLWKHRALEFRYPKHKHRLDLYADEPSLARDGIHYGVEHHERFAKQLAKAFHVKFK